MPLIIPDGLPAKDILEKEDVFFIPAHRACTQDIRPLDILILNLMPNKEQTETQLLRMLSNTILQVNVTLLHTASYEAKNTDKSYLNRFYKTFEDIRHDKYDGFIITGAPVEHLDFEDVSYWNEFISYLEFAKHNVFSTMFICWSAQAALYKLYGIKKRESSKKIFGVYEFEKYMHNNDRLLRGFDDNFNMPQSRHSYNHIKDFVKDELEILLHSNEAGVVLSKSKNNKFIFNAGHFEYDRGVLNNEYKRDVSEGHMIEKPINYYKNDANTANYSWSLAANMFFGNWLNYYVYQQTPFDKNLII